MARDVVVRMPLPERALSTTARRAFLERVAVSLIGRIQRRTESGVDVNGAPFSPYSIRYRDLREQSGRDGGTVSLHLTGNMLASMSVVRLDENEALIGFTGVSEEVRFARERTKTGNLAKGRKLAGGSRATQRLTHVGGVGAPVANAIKAAGLMYGTKPRRFFAVSAADKAAAILAARRASRRDGR